MIRMLISSFYNTLIDKEDAIPMSTMLEIDKLRNKGILFSVCTNKSKEDILYYNHDYPFIDYIISLNGCNIYDVRKDVMKRYIEHLFKHWTNKFDSIYEMISETPDPDIRISEKEEAILQLAFNYKKALEDDIGNSRPSRRYVRIW